MTLKLISIPENPVPEGGEPFMLVTSDGVELRAARFPARKGVPFKGTVCLFQGRAEFIEKYYETIEDLNERGFCVATLDWRGQGGSQRRLKNPRRGHVRHFDDFQLDMDVFMQDFALPECPPPFFALAHSMGGAVILEAARRRSTWFDRIVLSAPMISLPGFAADPLARRVAVLFTALGLSGLFVPGGNEGNLYHGEFARNPLTSDEKRFKRTGAVAEAAPHLCLGSPTIGWLRAAHRGMTLFEDPEKISEIRTPTLFIAAGDEKVVSNNAIEVLASQMRTAEVVTLPNARHELLMERDGIRDAFFAAFDAFIPGTPTFPD
ncbi:alpha/beta fold hydrolase [Flaviflagellibacter deserti]|uniref:Alpha/beta fold hydrolase n=1 Tax=Flaviflagellibacter deserti TaxID=2267266 RepID=A0ABV9YXR4_9HYPH